MDEGLGIQFEYTSPNTPQFNGVVERAFANIFQRTRALLNGTKLPLKLRHGLWAEAENTAIDLENTLVTPNKPVPSYTAFFEKEYAAFRTLHKFGEVGIVSYGREINKMKPKHLNRGRHCLYLGHAINHSKDTFRFLNLDTNRIIRSRDVSWLNKTYGEWKGIKTPHADQDEDPIIFEDFVVILDSSTPQADNPPPAPPATDEDDAHHVTTDEETNEPADNDDNDDATVVADNTVFHPTPRNRTSGLHRIMQNLAISFNPEAEEALETYQNQSTPTTSTPPTPTPIQGRGDSPVPEQANILYESGSRLSEEEWHQVLNHTYSLDIEAAYIHAELQEYGKPEDVPEDKRKDVFEAPRNFNQAWDHECPFQRKMWREAINKEFDKMEGHKVWKKVKKSVMPKDRRCVKCKWVFEVKRNGVFRARLVACGYSQVPGQDFNEVYSPVVNDCTVRILLIIKMILTLESMLVDIETAFLHGNLKEIIFMDCPPGMDHGEDECLQLLKTIYGLVQSARAFYRKLAEALKSIGFVQSLADPCLFIKNIKKGVCFVALWVDDCLFMGHKSVLQESVEMLQKYFKLKITNDTNDYLSCEIIYTKDLSRCWIGQPHLCRKIEKTFGELVKGLPRYRTPGTPGLVITKPVDPKAIISFEDQKLYRSGVGMLLYLVKYSRPDIANPVRELTKGMKEATPGALKELKRVLKYVIDTKDIGLKLAPEITGKVEWKIVLYTDSDWAGDKDSRKSITGYALFLQNCPVTWKSRQQDTIALSSSEAEINACTEACKEIKFVANVLESMGIVVEKPITVRVDNVGAIYMAENGGISQRTKHIDLKTKFVTQYVEDGFIKVVFVRSEDNKSDFFTKNVSGEIFDQHKGNFVMDRNEITE